MTKIIKAILNILVQNALYVQTNALLVILFSAVKCDIFSPPVLLIIGHCLCMRPASSHDQDQVWVGGYKFIFNITSCIKAKGVLDTSYAPVCPALIQ